MVMSREKMFQIKLMEREDNPILGEMYSDPCRGRGYSVRRNFS